MKCVFETDRVVDGQDPFFQVDVLSPERQNLAGTHASTQGHSDQAPFSFSPLDAASSRLNSSSLRMLSFASGSLGGFTSDATFRVYA